LASAALGLYASSSRADGTGDIESLLNENIVTTASTSAEKASTAPATSVTLTADDFRRYGIRSVDEAIDFLSVGLVTSDPLRTPDVGARGVLIPNDDGKHFLVLVNGHALNDPLYGAARFDAGLGVPFDAIDHIEAIIGPGSVLYGSDAMLGVINVITKDASTYRGGHVFAEYEPGRTARTGAGAGASFKLFGQDSELTASLEYFRRFGPDLAFANQPPQYNLGTGGLVPMRRGAPADGVWGGTVRSAYFTEAPSGALRLRVGQLEVNVLASLYRRGIPYSTPSMNVDFDDKDSSELDRALRIDVKHEATLSALVRLTSRAYADGFDYQRRVNRDAQVGCFQSDFTTCQYYDAGRARWVGLDERLSLNWLGDLSFVTLLGVDARMRWVSAKEDSVDYATGQPFAPTTGRIDDRAAIVSPYLQQTWSPTRSLDLNAGARLDADARFSPIASPRGALAVRPFENTTVKAVYSQAFRTPTWIETDGRGNNQALAGKLEPEIARSVEGVIEQRFAAQHLLFGVFRTWWDNLIEPTPLSLSEIAAIQNRGELPITAQGVIQYRNVSNIRNFGWNGSWDGSLVSAKLGYGVNATEAFTQRESAGGSRPLPVAPQFFGNAHVHFAAGGYVPTVAVAVEYVGARLVDRTFSDEYSHFVYADPLAVLRGTLSGSVPKIVGLAYRLTASYATAAHGPYAGGPRLDASLPTRGLPTGPSLVPIDRFSVILGLRYDFLTGGEVP
jgi:outer membrane cobalamin receptor